MKAAVLPYIVNNFLNGKNYRLFKYLSSVGICNPETSKDIVEKKLTIKKRG